MKFRFAISYHTETDATYAEALVRELERQGISAREHHLHMAQRAFV